MKADFYQVLWEAYFCDDFEFNKENILSLQSGDIRCIAIDGLGFCFTWQYVELFKDIAQSDMSPDVWNHFLESQENQNDFFHTWLQNQTIESFLEAYKKTEAYDMVFWAYKDTKSKFAKAIEDNIVYFCEYCTQSELSFFIESEQELEGAYFCA